MENLSIFTQQLLIYARERARRIVETNEGIQGEFNVETYDRFMKRMRDKGWIETSLVLKTGIEQGLALEIDPRPGYLGLE